LPFIVVAQASLFWSSAFGAGLGVFIAPNDHATINTVPANLAASLTRRSI